MRDLHSCMDTATGILFKNQTAAALMEAVEKFTADQNSFNLEYMRSHVSQFSLEIFGQRYLQFIDQCNQQKA